MSNVLGQLAIPDRILRHEPKQIRLPEVSLAVVDAITNQPWLRGQEVFQRVHVPGVDGGHRFSKERVANLGIVHDERCYEDGRPTLTNRQQAMARAPLSLSSKLGTLPDSIIACASLRSRPWPREP